MNQKFLDFAKNVTGEIIEELKSGNVICQKAGKSEVLGSLHQQG